MKKPLSDRQLMEQLYELYEQKMFMTAYSILQDHHQADIVITPATKSSIESSADSEGGGSDQTSIETGITGSSSYDFHPVKIKFSYLPEGVYFDASLSNSQDEQFLYTKIPAGQTVTFHIGFFVDEDYTYEMFFFTRGAARSYVLTDIREKK